jgi:hypothetical protein
VAAEGPEQRGFILDPHAYRYLGDVGVLTEIIGSGRGRRQKSYHDRSGNVGAVLQAGFVTPGAADGLTESGGGGAGG